MKVTLSILVVLLPLVYSESLNLYQLAQEEWNVFKTTHNKKYESATEEHFRMKIYLENRLKIAKHNSDKESSFKMEMNSFGDQLPHEFSSTRNGLRMDLMNNTKRSFAGTFLTPANVQIPDSVDWRDKGAVTDVKDQGQCGSCYSFSATGALEGQHFRQNGKLIPLSEQNLVDCSGAYGNEGCEGGLMDSCFYYIRDNQGIDTEKGYPYEARKGSCRYNTDDIGARDTGAMDIPHGDEQALMQAVATIGPISIAVDASNFQFYKGGIFYDAQCSTTSLNHGILAVGYGTENGHDYWLVKNSWGVGWGEEGYIRMSRNRQNNCGVASMASYPIV